MASFSMGAFAWTLDGDGRLEQVSYGEVPLFSRGTHPRVITLGSSHALFRVNEFTSSWEPQKDGTVRGVHVAPASFETEAEEATVTESIRGGESDGISVCHCAFGVACAAGGPLSLTYVFYLAPAFRYGFVTHGMTYTALGEFPLVEGSYEEGFDWNDQIDPEDTAHIDHWRRLILFYAPLERTAIGLMVPPAVQVRHLRVANSGVDETDAFFLSLGVNVREHGESRGEGPGCAFEWIGYRPGLEKFWWLEGMLYGGRSAGKIDEGLFPILTLDRRTYGTGERCGLSILRSGRGKGKERLVLRRIGGNETTVREWEASSDCGLRIADCGLEVPKSGDLILNEGFSVGDWKSGVYILSAGEKSTAFVVRPGAPSGEVLFVVSTNQWRAYATNGYYWGRHRYPWRYAYSATVMQRPTWWQSERHGPAPFEPDYLPPWWYLSTRPLAVAMDDYARTYGRRVDYCGNEDVYAGRVRLDDYRLVIYDSHTEYITERERRMVVERIRGGRGLLLLGGDNFGQQVEYVPGEENMRYQRLRVRAFSGRHQYGDDLRQETGTWYTGNVNYDQMTTMVVVDNRHPVMEGFEVGQEISEVFWEGDSVWYAMQVLAAFEHDGRWRPAVAVHPERNLSYFGPMGITRVLNGDIGDRENIRRLLFRLIEFGYKRASARL